MKKYLKLSTLMLATLLTSNTLANNYLTLNYALLNHNSGRIADVQVKISDTHLRTDYNLLTNNSYTVKFSELTIIDEGQYVLMHNKHLAYFLDYHVLKNKANTALKKMAAHMPGLSEEQIYEMSINPENDPDYFIDYQASAKNTFRGFSDGEYVQNVKVLPIPNKFLSKEQYDWLLTRAKQDTHFGKAYVELLEEPPIEYIRKFHYQSESLPVEITYDDFILQLESVHDSKINEQELRVDEDLISKDVTLEIWELLNELKDIAIAKGIIEKDEM